MEPFAQYLDREADARGLAGHKRSSWIQYMSDEQRGRDFADHMARVVSPADPKALAVLDVGCGYGSAALGLSAIFGEVSGIEIEDERVEWATSRAPGADIRQGSVTSMPWSDATFDCVTSTDVFEHIPFDQQDQAAREVRRVMRARGVAYITVPNKWQVIDEHNKVPLGAALNHRLRKVYVERFGASAYTQCWERTPRGWQQLFGSAGFEIVVAELPRPRGITVLPASRTELTLIAA